MSGLRGNAQLGSVRLGDARLGYEQLVNGRLVNVLQRDERLVSVPRGDERPDERLENEPWGSAQPGLCGLATSTEVVEVAASRVPGAQGRRFLH